MQNELLSFTFCNPKILKLKSRKEITWFFAQFYLRLVFLYRAVKKGRKTLLQTNKARP